MTENLCGDSNSLSYLCFVGEDGHFGLLSKESEDYHFNVEFS